MRIIYIHQYFKTPAMAGGTRSYEMARRMVSAGHEVHMITSDTDGKETSGTWRKEDIDGIHIHWLAVSYNNSMNYIRRILAFIQFALLAGRYAARIDADVVFATSTPLTVAMPAVKASRKRKIPMVFEVRDLWPEVPIAMGALNFPFAKFAARRLESWAYKNATDVIALSPGMCKGVERTGYPKGQIHCIPNSSDIALFSVPEEQGHVFRESRSWLGERPLVVYAGTFGRVNGVGYMVELAAAMKTLDPEVRFLAVGKGVELEEVQQKAQKLGVLNQNFFMEEALAKTEMPALLSAANLSISLVIPVEALWHNSANKFFDTLAAGRPIGINYGGWQADLIEETGAGIVFDHTDPSTAARQLCGFLGDAKAQADACRASAALARERFSRDLLAVKLITVLEEAAGNRGADNRIQSLKNR